MKKNVFRCCISTTCCIHIRLKRSCKMWAIRQNCMFCLFSGSLGVKFFKCALTHNKCATGTTNELLKNSLRHILSRQMWHKCEHPFTHFFVAYDFFDRKKQTDSKKLSLSSPLRRFPLILAFPLKNNMQFCTHPPDKSEESLEKFCNLKAVDAEYREESEKGLKRRSVAKTCNIN